MRKENTKKKNRLPAYLILLAAACSVLALALILSALTRGTKAAFIPPAFEAAAVSGVPEVPEGMGYERILRDGMAYCVYLCGEVALDNGEAVVWFTNPEENTHWLKLRIYDGDNTLIGETGLLKPGEYLRSVPVTGELVSGAAIKMRIMGYEPDTYLSAGAVTLSTVVAP